MHRLANDQSAAGEMDQGFPDRVGARAVEIGEPGQVDACARGLSTVQDVGEQPSVDAGNDPASVRRLALYLPLRGHRTQLTIRRSLAAAHDFGVGPTALEAANALMVL